MRSYGEDLRGYSNHWVHIWWCDFIAFSHPQTRKGFSKPGTLYRLSTPLTTLPSCEKSRSNMPGLDTHTLAHISQVNIKCNRPFSRYTTRNTLVILNHRHCQAIHGTFQRNDDTLPFKSFTDRRGCTDCAATGPSNKLDLVFFKLEALAFVDLCMCVSTPWWQLLIYILQSQNQHGFFLLLLNLQRVAQIRLPLLEDNPLSLRTGLRQKKRSRAVMDFVEGIHICYQRNPNRKLCKILTIGTRSSLMLRDRNMLG
jgi:hypothetical protein